MQVITVYGSVYTFIEDNGNLKLRRGINEYTVSSISKVRVGEPMRIVARKLTPYTYEEGEEVVISSSAVVSICEGK